MASQPEAKVGGCPSATGSFCYGWQAIAMLPRCRPRNATAICVYHAFRFAQYTLHYSEAQHSCISHAIAPLDSVVLPEFVKDVDGSIRWYLATLKMMDPELHTFVEEYAAAFQLALVALADIAVMKCISRGNVDNNAMRQIQYELELAFEHYDKSFAGINAEEATGIIRRLILNLLVESSITCPPNAVKHFSFDTSSV